MSPNPTLLVYSCSLLSLAALSLLCALARRLGEQIKAQVPPGSRAVKYD